MIVVRVELHSAITGKVTELARAHISNMGTGTAVRADYEVVTLRGRCAAALDKCVMQRRARVMAWPRQHLHVWNLVAEALRRLGYGRLPQQGPLIEDGDSAF